MRSARYVLIAAVLPALRLAAAGPLLEEDEECALTPERCARRGDALLQTRSEATAVRTTSDSITESEAAGWIDAVFQDAWPTVARLVQKVARREISKAMNDKLEGDTTPFSMKEFQLGNSMPKLGPVNVMNDGSSGVNMRVGFNYIDSVDAELTYGFHTLKISRLSVTGMFTVRSEQVLDQLPVVGGLMVYMAEKPKVSLSFEPSHDGLDIPVVKSFVEESVREVINNHVLLPNAVGHAVGTAAKGIDPTLLFTPPPKGVLRATVLGAKGFKSADRWRESDPRAMITVSGDKSWGTAYKDNTDHPTWSEGNQQDFLVYDKGQEVSVELLDNDWPMTDTLMGKTTMEVNGAVEADGTEVKLKDAHGSVAGSVHLGMKWLDAGGDGNSTDCIVAVKVNSVALPASMGDAAAVWARLGDEGDVRFTRAGTREVVLPVLPSDLMIQTGSKIQAGLQAKTWASTKLEAMALVARDWAATAQRAGQERQKPVRSGDILVNWALYMLAPRAALSDEALSLGLEDGLGKSITTEALKIPMSKVLGAERSFAGPFKFVAGNTTVEATMRVEVWGLAGAASAELREVRRRRRPSHGGPRR